MTDAQLYLAIGIPGFIALAGILVNTSLYIHLNTSLGQRISDLDRKWEARFADLDRKWEAKFAEFESKWDSRFDLLVGKIANMDLRLARLEDKVEHLERH